MGAGAADTAAERESLRTVPLTRCVTPHLRHSYSNPTNKKWHAGGDRHAAIYTGLHYLGIFVS